MLDKMQLQSFKCFDNEAIRFGKLTVLSGTNSAGKSSILHALILLADLTRTTPWNLKLELNRPGLNLGSASDVINYRSSSKSLSIRLTSRFTESSFEFISENRQALSMKLHSMNGQPINIVGPDSDSETSEVPAVTSLKRLRWISSERIGPRDVLPLLDSEATTGVGYDGAHAAALLYWNEDRRVTESIAIKEMPNTLYNQVRGRLRELFPHSDFRIVRLDTAIAISLGFKTSPESEYQRPQSVGFGYSQVFPILVDLLNSRPGDLLLIENPEIHLHPKAQQDLAIFITMVAASGVQIILETHSDHILNGVRLAVRRKKIEAQDIVFNFFKTDVEGHVNVHQPIIDQYGKLSSWPTGFFDQFDEAISELL